MPPKRCRSHLLVAVTAAACVGTVLAAAPADARSAYPGRPTGLHVSAVSAGAISVAAKKLPKATSYRLWTSTVASDLYVANLQRNKHSRARHGATSRSSRVTVRGLAYTTAPYYARLEADNGSRRAFSAATLTVGLRPATPTALRVSAPSSGTGTYLVWNSGAATGFRIAMSSTAGTTVFTTRGATRQFSPYGLHKGTTYTFRVQALNGSTRSAGWSNAVSATQQMTQYGLRAMTYNILQYQYDNKPELGYPASGKVAPWSRRGPVAAKLIHKYDPAVLGVEEGQDRYPSLTKGPGHQVSSLANYLDASGADYTVADTGRKCSYICNGFPGGAYVLYKTSVLQASSAGGASKGNFNLDHPGYFPSDVSKVAGDRFAAYQVLQVRSTGARFLAVATHLIPGGKSLDRRRYNETNSLLTQVAALRTGLPVIYLGDFNSNAFTKAHNLDGAGVSMRAHNIADSRLASPTRYNENYYTMNHYARVAPHGSYHNLAIDYVFAGPGVAVSSWGVGLTLSHGKFVGTIPSDHNPVWATLYLSR